MFHFLNNSYLQIRGIHISKGKIIKLTGVNFWMHKNIYFNWDIFINKFCSILAGRKSKIEFWDWILIWPWVVVTSTNHSTKISDKLFDNIWEEKDVKIWNEVWIWANSVILPWVEIADGTIVWAGSVVTKSVTITNTIVAGVPAKFIKERN